MSDVEQFFRGATFPQLAAIIRAVDWQKLGLKPGEGRKAVFLLTLLSHETERTVADIAADLGFSDKSFFRLSAKLKTAGWITPIEVHKWGGPRAWMPDWNNRLREVFGDAIQRLSSQKATKILPTWEKIDRTWKLSFNGELLRTVKPRADSRIAPILDEFQSRGWPEKVFPRQDPLRPGFAKAISSLNEGLNRLRFSADGTGTGVIWQQLS